MNDVHYSASECADRASESSDSNHAKKETRRRDRIAIGRRKYVVGEVALKQFALRPTGVFADALWWHIKRDARSSTDRALFNLAPLPEEDAARSKFEDKDPRDDNGHHLGLPRHGQPALSWVCAFCQRLRIFEGGHAGAFGHLDTCVSCGSRVAAAAVDQASVTHITGEHLL